MHSAEEVSGEILRVLLAHFLENGLSAKNLRDGYAGPAPARLKEQLATASRVDFDLAMEDLEAKKLVDTGPKVAIKNDPGSPLVIIGLESKREHVHLTENGYRLAQKLAATAAKLGSRPVRPDPALLTAPNAAIHTVIWSKCGKLYENGAYAEAVEKSFRIVRDRLRALTGYETGADAFGKGQLHVAGAIAPHVDEDFNKGVQFLTMAIDRFRNEKAHTSDGNIEAPVRAIQYLIVSSLALSLLERAAPRAKS